MMHNMDGWTWVWMYTMMILFWGALVVFAVWAVRALIGRGHSPLDIARERYARGEITREEFEEIQRGILTVP